MDTVVDIQPSNAHNRVFNVFDADSAIILWEGDRYIGYSARYVPGESGKNIFDYSIYGYDGLTGNQYYHITEEDYQNAIPLPD